MKNEDRIRKLDISAGADVSGADTLCATPVVVQEEGLPVGDALAYLKDTVRGKRKIAKSLTSKGALTTEYDTFDEMASRIDRLPLRVEGEDGILPQNGNTLLFYDVYNEMRKAYTRFGGRYPYCCVFEITNIPATDTITLSGADAYYTSDGEFYEQTKEHTFNDKALEYTNRFVVYFFANIDYNVPFNLPSANRLYVLNGQAMISVASGNIRDIYNYSEEQVNSIDSNVRKIANLSTLYTVYDNSLTEISGGDHIFSGISNLHQLNLPNLTSISGGYSVFSALPSLQRLSLPNLTSISGGTYLLRDLPSLRQLELAGLRTITGGSGIIYYIGSNYLEDISLPNLKEFTGGTLIYSATALTKLELPLLDILGGTLFISSCPKVATLSVPNLKEQRNTTYSMVNSNVPGITEIDLPCLVNAVSIMTYTANLQRIALGAPQGGSIRVSTGDGKTQVNTTLTDLTVGAGFHSALDCTACNALTHDSLVGILDNLADNSDGTPIKIVFGSVNLTKLTEEEIAVGTGKNYIIN